MMEEVVKIVKNLGNPGLHEVPHIGPGSTVKVAEHVEDDIPSAPKKCPHDRLLETMDSFDMCDLCFEDYCERIRNEPSAEDLEYAQSHMQDDTPITEATD